MELHNTITKLIEAQNNFDAEAYASCFTTDATVGDEGHEYAGRAAIKEWITKANQQYQATMKALSYDGNVLKAEVSGSFSGSPLVLEYRLELDGELIRSLRIE